MKETEKKELDEKKSTPVALDLNDLNLVTGAGDPFAEEPRVPENPIDPDLREDG